MSEIMRMLSLDEVLRNPAMLVAQSAREIAETRLAAHMAAAALDAAHEAAVAEPQADSATEPGWLTVAEVEAKYGLKKRWLFDHRRELPFVRNVSRKTILINEKGLTRWLASRSSVGQ